MNKFIFPFVFILGVLTACSDKLQPEPDNPADSGNPISIENTDLIFYGSSDHGTVSFTSENMWIIDAVDSEGPPSWFTVSRLSGDKGTAVIEVKVTEENPYDEDRNAFIRIKSAGYVSLITVTQKKKDAIIASKDNVWLDSRAQSFGIDVQDNTDYEVIIPPQYTQWISRQNGSGSSPGRESFSVSAVTGNESRTGMIVFDGGGRADTVYVYQRGKDRSFLLENTVYLNSGPAKFHIPVENTEFTVRIEGGTWLDYLFSSTSFASYLMDKSLRIDKAWFAAGTHFEPDYRSVKVIFTDVKSKLSDTLTVIQRGTAELLYYPRGEYPVGAEGEILTAQVAIDRYYDIRVPQDFSSWLSVGTKTPAPGGQSSLLPVTVSPNRTNYVRHGYVVMATPDLIISDTIFIKQVCDPDNRGALISFYEATGGSGWRNKANWCSDKPLDQWYGITTDAEGKVSGIELPGNNLSGRVIDYTVELLENLEKLDLSGNKITWVTPRIGNSKTLRYFDISDNQINSTLPEEYVNLIYYLENGGGNLKDMDKFCVNDNFYYGKLPLYFSGALFLDEGRYFFDVVKQKGPGFKASENTGLEYYLPDVQYTDIDGRQFGLRNFCGGNEYTILFRSKSADLQTTDYLKKLNVIARSSIPNYKIGVVWDAVDTGLSAEELTNIRQTYNLDITIANATSGQVREKFKFGEKSEFYLARKKRPADIFNLNWVEMFNYDVQPLYDFLLPSDLYFSSDYSKDKTYRTVQLATVGRGVDIVFAGDGFTDRDIANGSYDRYAEAAFEAFFMIEPLKSLRDRFNCYVVYAVSRNNDADHPSYYNVFGSRPGAYKGTIYDGDLSLAQYIHDVTPIYAACAPIHDYNTTTVIIASNYSRITMGKASVSSTFGIAVTTTGPDFERYKQTMLHEMGHAYGKLDDEYYSSHDPYPEEAKTFTIWDWEHYEMWGNVDFTDDLSQIKWKQFIGIPKYSCVGAFEGASRHLKGIWRPEILSIMQATNYLYFNAPSREQLYKRTMTLSGDTYSFEDFVAQDDVTAPPVGAAVRSSTPGVYLNPPIIIMDRR